MFVGIWKQEQSIFAWVTMKILEYQMVFEMYERENLFQEEEECSVGEKQSVFKG